METTCKTNKKRENEYPYHGKWGGLVVLFFAPETGVVTQEDETSNGHRVNDFSSNWSEYQFIKTYCETTFNG